jgi:methionine aminopeptidase
MIEEMRFRTDNSAPLTLVRDGDMIQIEIGADTEDGCGLQNFTFQASDPHDMECLTRFLQTAARFRDEAIKAAQDGTT